MNSTKRRLGDRRGRARFEIVGQLWGSLESVEPLALHNLSRGGALLESGVLLQLDSVHRLRFAIGGQVADIQARVRHIAPISTAAGHDRYLIGLEFVAVLPATLETLDRLVAAHLDAAERTAES